MKEVQVIHEKRMKEKAAFQGRDADSKLGSLNPTGGEKMKISHKNNKRGK